MSLIEHFYIKYMNGIIHFQKHFDTHLYIFNFQFSLPSSLKFVGLVKPLMLMLSILKKAN